MHADVGRVRRPDGRGRGRAAGAGSGSSPGDRVAIVMRNRPEYLEALFAIWHAGLVAVPVNARLHRDEIAYVLDDSGAAVVVTDDEHADDVEPLVGVVAALRAAVRGARPSEWDRLTASSPVPLVDRRRHDPAWLFYTSGTTGRPKGATLTHRNLLMASLSYFADIDPVIAAGLHPARRAAVARVGAVRAAARRPRRGERRAACPAASTATRSPPSSSAGRACRCSPRRPWCKRLAGDPRGRRRRPVAPEDRSSTAARRCTWPTSRTRSTCFGPRLAQIYGQGETPMTITALSKADHADARPPAVAGARAERRRSRAPTSRCASSTTTTAGLPTGEVGEVVVRGDVVMAGYWDEPDATAETLRGGWLHTGDIGSFDADGYLTLRDRSKDLIISGGMNIYPREVEEALLRHPGVRRRGRRRPSRPRVGRGRRRVRRRRRRRPRRRRSRSSTGRASTASPGSSGRRSTGSSTPCPTNNYGKVLKRELRERLGAGAVPTVPERARGPSELGPRTAPPRGRRPA